MIANGWHVGAARFVITAALLFTNFEETTASTIHRNPHPDGHRPLERAAQWFRQSQTAWGPPKTETDMNCTSFGEDCKQQWEETQIAVHPAYRQQQLDPSHEYALQLCLRFGTQIGRWRQTLVEDLDNMIQELEDDTNNWFQQTPTHVQKTYRQWQTIDPGFNTLQVPTIIKLLETIDFGDTDTFSEELTHGFQMIGNLTPGTGWKQRSDLHYNNPSSETDFAAHNKQYIRECLTTRKSDEHTDGLLQEILQEVQMGRIDGPFRKPNDWTTETVQVNNLPLLEPDEVTYTAMAFPILQTGSDGKDKVRRGEDWRRSGHNSTVHVIDQPHHHNIDCFVSAGRRVMELDNKERHSSHGQADGPSTTSRAHMPPLLWGHDHEGAYRQLPLRKPNEAYLLLMCKKGPTLWRHNALLFGAVASVWGYNRFGDSIIAIMRALFGVPAMHYVDDFGASEFQWSADSGFHTFREVNRLLGLRTKRSKEQEPATSHKIQGTIISFHTTHATVAPTEDRVFKINNIIQKSLHNNTLSPEKAGE